MWNDCRFAVRMLRKSPVFAAVASGVAIGGPLALASVRTLKNLLFGVTATDALTFVLSIAVLTISAAMAIAAPLWTRCTDEPLGSVANRVKS